MPGDTVTLISPEGKAEDFSPAEVADRLKIGYSVEGTAGRAARIGTETREGDISGAESFGQGVGRGFTAGGTDVLQSALGGEDARRHLRTAEEAHPDLSTAGDITGAVLPALFTGGESAAARILTRGPAGYIGKLGTRLAESEGAGALTQIGRGVLGGSAEGALYGGAGAVSEFAQSDDPLAIERLGSSLPSHMLYGAGVGGIAGGLGKTLEVGLGKAKAAIERSNAANEAAGRVPEDLAALDIKGLQRARDAEVETIKASRKAEGQSLADDIKAMREEQQQVRAWQATEGATDKEVRTIGKQALNADRPLRNLLDNPKYLAEKPEAALSGLQKQEHAFEEMLRVEPKLRAEFAADVTPARANALDAVPGLLEKNRALQDRIRAVSGPPSSPKLQAIADARESFSTRAAQGPKSILETAVGGSVFGAVAGAAHALPIPGAGLLGLAAAAKASKYVTDKLFSKTVKATAARSTAGVQKFLDVTAKVAPVAPVLATKVLSAVRYAPPQEKRPTKGETTLASSYLARSNELKSQTAYGPEGAPVMRPEARAAMAKSLAGVKASDPIMADRMETIATRRIEFLSSKIPRRPDMGIVQAGPDRWQPSDMAMRTFARYAAAVEDPHAIVDRLVAGTITPEDTEVMKKVYPEMHADITRQIIMGLPTLKATLPYQRRLALSIFSGVPVDASMSPPILKALQSNFADEDGSAGGTEAPTAKPQFGSVHAEKATPAQSRGNLETSQ